MTYDCIFQNSKRNFFNIAIFPSRIDKIYKFVDIVILKSAYCREIQAACTYAIKSM